MCESETSMFANDMNGKEALQGKGLEEKKEERKKKKTG